MNKLKLYHGSEFPVEKPLYKFGKTTNDYGQGFYCSNDEELAKEWACKNNKDGYVNLYELKMDNLKILNLLDEKYNILNWIALLLKNRSFLVNDTLSKQTRNYIIKNFYIDVSEYDVVIGYRADDSYFSYAQSLIDNSLSIESLNKALRLGNLGIQIVLISEKSFESIEYINSKKIESKIYNKKYIDRDKKARNDYKKLISEDALENTYIIDIIRKEIKTMIRAYEESYLSDAVRNLSAAFDYAINVCKLDVEEFSSMFLSSRLSKEFELGNPYVISGTSGVELINKIIKEIYPNFEAPEYIIPMSKSKEYWAGYYLAQYQWYTARSFSDIFRKIPLTEIIDMYYIYHELDISHFIDELNKRYKDKKLETKLKMHRTYAELSQSELAKRSGVSLRLIQLYEQRVNDINKAQVHTIYKLARALYCKVEDLLEDPQSV